MAIRKDEYDPRMFLDNADGKYLYRYTPLNNFSLQTILNNTLYFSNPNMLNDPLDCYTDVVLKNEKPFSKAASDFIINFQPNIPYYLNLHTKNVLFYQSLKIQSEFIRDFFVFHTNENFGVCSFSKTISEELLWCHYADGCQGICLIFDKEILIKSLLKNLAPYYKLLKDFVIYDTSCRQLKIEVFEKPLGFEETQEHLFTKKSNWKYEQEYRLVIKRGKIPKFSHPESHKFSHIVAFDKKALVGIAVGERMPKENFIMLNNILKPAKKEYVLLSSLMSFD